MSSNNFAKNYALIKSKISKYSTYSLYIEFSIGDKTYTTDTNSGYLMSLENTKNGTGMCNNFILNLAYCPDPHGTNITDVNMRDLDIVVSNNLCKLRYGYIFPDGTRLLTPQYQGRVTGYTVEIQDAMLLYRIEGYSSVLGIRDSKVNHSEKELKDLAGSNNPIDLVIGILNEAIKNNSLVGKYKVVNSVKHKAADNSELFKEVRDQYVMQYVNSILNGTRAESQKDISTESTSGDDADNEITTKLIRYSFVVNDEVDSDSEATIEIVSIDPENTEKQTPDVTFDWMSGKPDDIVLNFAPDFKGELAMASAQALFTKMLKSTVGEELKDNVTIDSCGEIIDNLKKTVYTKNISTISGDSSSTDLLSSEAIMALFAQDVYNATLTTLGIVGNIPILTHIVVNPLIYGCKHHTAGEYYVTKLSDSLSSAGFTTTFELCKVSGGTEYQQKLLDKYTNNLIDKVTDVAQNALDVVSPILGLLSGE